eukprot:EG_transcript_5079
MARGRRPPTLGCTVVAVLLGGLVAWLSGGIELVERWVLSPTVVRLRPPALRLQQLSADRLLGTEWAPMAGAVLPKGARHASTCSHLALPLSAPTAACLVGAVALVGLAAGLWAGPRSGSPAPTVHLLACGAVTTDPTPAVDDGAIEERGLVLVGRPRKSSVAEQDSSDGCNVCLAFPGNSNDDSADPFPRWSLQPSQFSLMTLNIHVPIHKRLDDGRREADCQAEYLPRNCRVVQRLLASNPSVACLQEFWVFSEALLALYRSALEPAGYALHITPRTNSRGDGLLTAVSRRDFDVLHVSNFQFYDCGDRVAQILHLRAAGRPPGEAELLLANTHLMFPHNQNSTVIRLRQCAKMLAALRGYIEQYGLGTIPIVICGDWNGTANGRVARFMQSQGFVSVYDELHGPSQRGTRWVTHLTHKGKTVGVDCIWLLNPSSQLGSLSADWRLSAFASVTTQLISQEGLRDQATVLPFFDRLGRGWASYTDFAEGIVRLGLTGPDSAGLLAHEIKELAQACDRDGDGRLTAADFALTFNIPEAVEALRSMDWKVPEYLAAATATTCPMRTGPNPKDISVVAAALPDGFNAGQWPPGYQDRISDHAPLAALFQFPR